jgi:hypothetical protein
MRVSIWKQDRKGKRWRRIGVVALDAGGALPFKTLIPHGEDTLPERWPCHCWYTIERHAWSLFDHEGRA